MEFTKEFKDLGRNDAKIAGGKGASLGEMTQAGIPVPPGFVVLADSFDHFVEEAEIGADIDAIIEEVNHKDINSVEQASEKIRGIILETEFPDDIGKEIESEFKKLDTEFVAVRSSATAEDASDASWAGELESYLNTSKTNLLENVKKCWSSLFTPRAIFYRFEKGMDKTHVAVAVVIQKMVQSEVSGISFTVHPVTKDENQMIIEAGFGLGEAIVGGLITPDSYIFEKNNGSLKIVNKYISEQSMMIIREASGTKDTDVPEDKKEVQKITDDQIFEIGKICLNIEKHYGFPCDIEWAFEDGKFYVVQSRPITTL
jgi:pyruvate,water dikinase